MGDVLKAREGAEEERRSFRLSTLSRTVVDDDGCKSFIVKGAPFISTPLPNIFNGAEWETIRDFNKNTTERIRDARVPQDYRRHPYIVIPHAKSTTDQIAFLKNIGYKAKLFSSPDVLRVMDEDVESMDSVSCH